MNNPTRNHLKEAYKNPNLYYVLITCTKPSDSGEMQVEMSYNGEADLVSYLLENAISQIEHAELEYEAQ